ncbi:hypothetical protein [Spirillospora sp. CA-294931]|uniref:hypothetical protein n=1 Tax=Spirillospora sp. CA-294931 TaxID=3240042 RepID=UPI003D93BB04
MQLPRVIIAAVFFVIGALIAIPALMNNSSPSRASSTPAGSNSTTSPSPTPTKTPTPGKTTKPPTAPLTVTIGGVSCPGRTVEVKVANTGKGTEDYSVERNDDSAAVAGRIGPGATRTSRITLREDRRTRVTVSWKNDPVKNRTLKANCKKAAATPEPSETPGDLPHTGADDAVLWARAATGGAAMITGAIIFWYGGIWPRRRDKIFSDKTAG